VGRPLPFQFTVEVVTKLEPFRVRVKAGPPAMALAGTNGKVIAGIGLLQVNVCALEVPPPGVGLKTVTVAVPPTVQSEAGTVACSCVAVWETIARLAPFHMTWEEGTKLVPVTVRVKAGPNAVTLAGESGEVVVGTGLLTVKLIAAEVPPPGVGVKTVTGKIPAVAVSVAGTTAVI
jgi:hypothetical protein